MKHLRLKQFLSKQTLNHLKRITTISTPSLPSPLYNPIIPQLVNPPFSFKTFHSSPHINHTARAIHQDDSNEAKFNEFLSRFVYIMRGKLNEGYPHCEKPTIDAMLLVIVDNLVNEMEKGGNFEDKLISNKSGDLSEDLWETVWEVSNKVYQEMEKERKKDKLKMFLQSDDVKSMARFASEVGVRGDMLHELRFKWAREEMEKAEFFENDKSFEQVGEKTEVEGEGEGEGEGEAGVDNGGSGGLPKRHGKIKYKLYGLDLSGSEWREVADKVNEVGEGIWPKEAKTISGKCKLVTEKILGLGRNDDYESVVSPLLNEWKELLQPNRVDWISLIHKLKEKDDSLYLKVAEHVLDEPSFQANIRDYSKLIDAHAKENRVEDIERLLKKMSESGMPQDIVTLTALLHMYSKTNNLKQAQEAYDAMTSQGFKPDMDVYNSMIMLYVNCDQLKKGEQLMREMELKDIKPTEEIYLAFLRAFASKGDITGANRIVTSMQFAGIQPTLESCTYLIEACSKSNNSYEARNSFDYMMKLGFKPDDRSTSLVISAYEKKNELDRALDLLLRLEKDGFEPGVHTYSVMLDWMGKLQLIDEAEQILDKISHLGEAPPFEIQLSLCEMYARAGIENKALQALGVLEANKDLLGAQDFERVIRGLLKGGFTKEGKRMQEMMEAQGFAPSKDLDIELIAAQVGRSSVRRQ